MKPGLSGRNHIWRLVHRSMSSRAIRCQPWLYRMLPILLTRVRVRDIKGSTCSRRRAHSASGHRLAAQACLHALNLLSTAGHLERGARWPVIPRLSDPPLTRLDGRPGRGLWVQCLRARVRARASWERSARETGRTRAVSHVGALGEPHRRGSRMAGSGAVATARNSYRTLTKNG